MGTRFAVRRSEAGYGVWDAAVNGWHSPQDLDEPAAVEACDQMNAEFRLRSMPPAPSEGTGSGAVFPARRVLIHAQGKWWPGWLDHWVRRSDGWYGRAVFAVDNHGVVSWYAAHDLRPADR